MIIPQHWLFLMKTELKDGVKISLMRIDSRRMGECGLDCIAIFSVVVYFPNRGRKVVVFPYQWSWCGKSLGSFGFWMQVCQYHWCFMTLCATSLLKWLSGLAVFLFTQYCRHWHGLFWASELVLWVFVGPLWDISANLDWARKEVFLLEEDWRETSLECRVHFS